MLVNAKPAKVSTVSWAKRLKIWLQMMYMLIARSIGNDHGLMKQGCKSWVAKHSLFVPTVTWGDEGS